MTNKESEFYLGEALKIAQNADNKPYIKSIYKSYRILYENLGDYKKSLSFFKKFETIKDEIIESQNTIKVTQLNSQFQKRERVEINGERKRAQGVPKRKE